MRTPTTLARSRLRGHHLRLPPSPFRGRATSSSILGAAVFCGARVRL